MIWNDSLTTGVASIDNQHRELLKQIDDLLTAGMNQKGSEKIKETMDFLGKYIVKHFQDEEALQKSSNYPKAVLHKSLHDHYVASYNRLEKQYATEGESLNIILAVNKSVVDWLVNHINVHDKAFAMYYKKQQ